MCEQNQKPKVAWDDKATWDSGEVIASKHEDPSISEEDAAKAKVIEDNPWNQMPEFVRTQADRLSLNLTTQADRLTSSLRKDNIDVLVTGEGGGEAEIMKELLKASTVHVEKKDPHWLLDSRAFSMLVYGTIIANSVQMGLAVDYPELVDVWTAMEHVFLVVFLFEMLTKQYFLGLAYFRKGWNRLDFFLVWMAIVDQWLIPLMMMGADSPMGSMKILRILRVLRVARMARLLKVFKELFMIVKGILSCLKTIFWVCLLLVLTMYVSSIVLVDLLGRKTAPYGGWNDDVEAIEEAVEADTWNNYMHFGTIYRSMFTMFKLALSADLEMVAPVAERQLFLLFAFVAFIIFVTFGVVNVIIGVIVDSTNKAAREAELLDVEKIKKERFAVLLQMRDIMFTVDTDGDKKVSLAEMQASWDNPKLQHLLFELNIPRAFSAEEMMIMLDSDCDGQLTYEDFLRNMYRLINCDPFQQNCSLQVSLNDMKRSQIGLQHFCEDLCHHLCEVTASNQILLQEMKEIKHEIRSVSSSQQQFDADSVLGA